MLTRQLRTYTSYAITIALFLFFTPSITEAITVDAGSMPISGATQWHSATTPAFSTGVQFQVVRNIRTGASSLRLLYVNNTSRSITFLASVRKSFTGTPEMVSVSGTTTIVMAPYTATTSDPLSFSVSTGDYVYDRSYFPYASSSQTFSSGMTFGTYNPESISVPGSVSGYNLMVGYATTSTNRLLETDKTFERDIVLESTANYEFGAYAVVGIPTDPTVTFTNVVGDSKTADFTQDVTSGISKPWNVQAFGKRIGAPFQNLALGGDILANLINPGSNSSFILRKSLFTAFPADTVNHYGTNSINNGSSATTSTATELGYISQLKSLIGSYKLYQVTVDPSARKTATSSWSTITEADQSPAGDLNNGIAIPLYFNNFIKTNKPSYIDGVIDLAAITTTQNGYWRANMTTDGIHQNNNANTLQANAFDDVWPVATTTQTISNISATTSTSTATLSWNTSTAASTRVNYGLVSSYAASTTEVATTTRITSHSVSLTGLRPCTKYNFQADGYSTYFVRATSSNQTFLTLGCTGSASVATSTDSNSITTASGGSFNFGTSTIVIPPSFTATSSSAVFQAKQLDHTTFFTTAGRPTGKTAAGSYVLNLTALTDATTTLSTFLQPISVTLSYSDSDVEGLDPSSLKIYRYDEGTGWTMLDSCTRDANAKTVTCTTTHFSDFVLFGTPADTSSGGFSTETTVIGTTTYVTKAGVTSIHTSSLGTNYSTTVSPLGTTPIVPVTSTTTPVQNSIKNTQASSSTVVSAQPFFTSPRITFSKNLMIGSLGAEVRNLQKFLNAHGFVVSKTGGGSIGHETSQFGQKTREALAKFQKKNNIKPANGYFGPVTRKIVNDMQ